LNQCHLSAIILAGEVVVAGARVATLSSRQELMLSELLVITMVPYLIGLGCSDTRTVVLIKEALLV
jgi:hypothetical protein